MYTKLDEKTLQVTTEKTVTKTQNYSLDYLKEQEVDILKSINDYVEKQKTELANIQDLIAKCKELDIKPPAEIKAAELEVQKADESAKVDAIQPLKGA